MIPIDPECKGMHHNTASAFRNYGCRCPETLRLEHKRKKRWYVYGDRRYVDKTVTIRRIRALMANGWSIDIISQELGKDISTIRRILYYNHTKVLEKTALEIRRLYDELDDIHGPSTRVATMMRKEGYFPPQYWDDIDNPESRPRRPDYGSKDSIDAVLVERAVYYMMADAPLRTPLELNAAEKKAALVLVRGKVTEHAIESVLRTNAARNKNKVATHKERK